MNKFGVSQPFPESQNPMSELHLHMNTDYVGWTHATSTMSMCR